MSLIKSLMGRRQFLIAAGAASSSALAYKRLAGVIDPSLNAGNAMPAERSGAAADVVTNKYPHLLSHLKVRNRILKNRIMHTPSPPHALQGPENFPADSYRAHYSQMAKNAAIVTIVEHFGQYPKTWSQSDTASGMEHYSDSIWEDIPPVHNYLQQMVEEIHCEGSLVSVGKLQSSTVEEAVKKAKQWEDRGYDVIEVGERSWSGIEAVKADLDKLEAVRKATDLIIEAVILPCTPGRSRGPSMGMGGGGMPSGRGEGMPSGAQGGQMPSGGMSVQAQAGRGSGMPAGGGIPLTSTYSDATGPEMEEVLEMVRLIDGLADILRMKDVGHCTNHPNSFVMEKDKPLTLAFAQAIKESGAKIITAPNGGFHYPELNDEWIASGKTDMVAMATPLFADPEYVRKLYEGRAEDIVPCVMCHDCHGVSRTSGPWFDVCKVNPTWGLSETKKRSIRPPTSVKKVAVIGGGPSGMKAAITAAERGHKVTLYEKGDALGGLLRHTDYTKWKWSYKDYKDYLVTQVKKAGIEVKLNTPATPEMIRQKGFDTVLVAIGADPAVSRIQGADGKNVYNIMDAYSKMKSLGKNVVIIGAGVYGTETAICLAKDGYKITIITSEKQLIPNEAIGPHNMENQLDISQNHPNISRELEAVVTGISDGKVTYRDAAGNEKSVKADSVVIYAGLKAKMDEAAEFSGSAGQVLLLGDCTGQGGTLQKTIRSAFFVASQV
ncbi:MAG: FAD-dependent oxidoreductase [Deltaproteobacteria bacterium]|nr:FAD-dependent oxidoreductase [Deltaproteobacteria bacterium]